MKRRNLIKPPLLRGRTKGRGDPKAFYLVHPHPFPPPSEGRECPYNYGLISKNVMAEIFMKRRLLWKHFLNFSARIRFFLLFLTVGLAVWVGRFSVKGYGLGMVAAAIVVGVAIATWASTYGVKLQLDNFAKSLMYYLFMYGVGLRVGPSFFNSLKKDGLTFTILAVVCAVLGLVLCVVGSRMFGLPAGAVGGVLAGSQTMSAAIGTAEMAVTQGAYKVPEGSTPEAISAMIALGYGITYIWGTVGIILICKYLPKWWGVDAKKAAKEYEEKFGVPNLDDVGLSGYRPGGLRAYRLENKQTAGKSIAQFRQTYPQYRIVNIVRGEEALGASPDLVMQAGDVIALGGRLEDLTANMGLLGPEVHDVKALAIPLDQAEILVTQKGVVGKELKEFRHEDFAGQLQVYRMERGGAPFPVGAETKLQRFDVIFVAGLRSAVEKLAAVLGRIARPSTGNRPPDAFGGHDSGPPDRRDQRTGGQLQGRPGKRGRTAALGHPRLVGGLAPALLWQHAQRGA